jgi:hypothetical protein
LFRDMGGVLYLFLIWTFLVRRWLVFISKALSRLAIPAYRLLYASSNSVVY